MGFYIWYSIENGWIRRAGTCWSFSHRRWSYGRCLLAPEVFQRCLSIFLSIRSLRWYLFSQHRYYAFEVPPRVSSRSNDGFIRSATEHYRCCCSVGVEAPWIKRFSCLLHSSITGCPYLPVATLQNLYNSPDSCINELTIVQKTC